MNRLTPIFSAIFGSMAMSTPLFAGDPPVSGRPVPSMSVFDDLMIDYMNDRDIEAGVLGIMNDGEIVYLRGFGYLDGDVPLPENSIWRLASVSKPVTAAAVRNLIADGWFELDWDAFNINGSDGIITINPWPSLGDSDMDDITVDHLLNHEGGWDDGVQDQTYMETEIADEMDISSPPGITNTMRWILGNPLHNNPGTGGPGDTYNNTGYLALGMMVSQYAPSNSNVTYIRQNILTPDMWVPSTEVIRARTFKDDQNPREPWYENSPLVWSVFNSIELVEQAYGGFDMEARVGQGGIAASPAAMLTFADHYRVGYSGRNIGMPLTEAPLTSGSTSHNGSQAGVATFLIQRADGINVFIAFNERADSGEGHHATTFYNDHVSPTLADTNAYSWPNTTSDGFWIVPNIDFAAGLGGYHAPFLGVQAALDGTTNGSKWRLKPGVSTFIGTINQKVLIDAPLGDARIGG